MTKPIYGTYYVDLYRLGWFNSDRVIDAFEVDGTLPKGPRTLAIKQKIYELAGVDSLAKLEPLRFLSLMTDKGLASTLPSSLRFLGERK